MEQDMELLLRPKANSSTKEDADGRVGDIMETISSDGPNPEEAFVRMQEAQVDHLLNQLTPKELFIIQQRFGLDDGAERTLQDIGDELGVTRECIRKIEARALKKMRCHAGATVEP
jgi:RNA polymerase primary sigma factor